MDMSQGSEKIIGQPKAPEASQETVRALDRKGFMSLQAEILALSSDALNVSKGLEKQGLVAERKLLLSSVFAALEGTHPQKLVLVTETDGKITGCMIVDRGEHARVEHLWTRAGSDGQPSVINSLINAALDKLKHGPYTHGPKLHIPANPTTRSRGLDQYVWGVGAAHPMLVIESGAANDDEPSKETV